MRLLCSLLLLTAACATSARRPCVPDATGTAREVAVQPIPLAGPVAAREAELSGMAWHGDTLVLLPQFPERFQGGGAGALFGLSRKDILAFLEGRTSGPLTPRPIPLEAPGLEAKLPGSQGFESIAFVGERVFLTAEARVGGQMKSYLVSGTVAPDVSAVQLDASRVAEVPAQSGAFNQADEALVVAGDRLFTLYEANGQALNPNPVAHVFGLDLSPRGTMPSAHLEYRLTDATPPDAEGRFWAINYFYPGDTDMRVAREPLAQAYGRGPTHACAEQVERLLQLQVTPEGIRRVEAPPVQLQLRPDGKARNWEALAVLEGRGLLLATDTYPETLLGFVPLP